MSNTLSTFDTFLNLFDFANKGINCQYVLYVDIFYSLRCSNTTVVDLWNIRKSYRVISSASEKRMAAVAGINREYYHWGHHFLENKWRLKKTEARFHTNFVLTAWHYNKSDYADKTEVRSSYTHNENSFTDKTASSYWNHPSRELNAYVFKTNTSWDDICPYSNTYKYQ